MGISFAISVGMQTVCKSGIKTAQLLPIYCTCSRVTLSRKMASLASIPVVDIDASGVFKYVLIKASQGSDNKILVRGYSWGSFHADIYEDFESKNSGLQLSCLGGGRIEHVPEAKKLFVYGYSVGFGKADHKVAVRLLKEAYPQYTDITYSDEGY